MSPGSAVEHVKTRLSKLKRSSTSTLNKLRRRKSTESRGSTGSLPDAAPGPSVTPGRRSLSDRSLRDSWFSRGARHADDGASVYSFRTHASSSESVASEAQNGAAEAETQSVGSGSNATTVSDSTFPHTPDNSFKAEGLPPVSEDWDQGLETPTLAKSISEDFVPVPEIIVDPTGLEDDEQDSAAQDVSFYSTEDHEQDSTAQDVSFSSTDDDDDARPELPAEPSGLSLMALPLETIYEVDSACGSQMGLSAFPSAASQFHPSASSEPARDDASTAQAPLSPERRSVALEASHSDASLLRALAAAAFPPLSPEAAQPARAAAAEEYDSDVSYGSLAGYTSGDSSYGAPTRPPGLGLDSDVFLAREDAEESARALLPSASRPFLPALPTDSSMGSSASDSSQEAPSDNFSAPSVEPATGGETSICTELLEEDGSCDEGDGSCDEASGSAVMSDISGIEYLPAQPTPAPPAQVVDPPSAPAVDTSPCPAAQLTSMHLSTALSGVDHALASLPSGDPAASLFACDSAVFTTSTPASRSCILPPDEDRRAAAVGSSSPDPDRGAARADPTASVSPSADAACGVPPEGPAAAASAGQASAAATIATEDGSAGSPGSAQPEPASGGGGGATPLAPGRRRALTTRLSACAKLVCAVAGRAVGGGPARSSYLATLPPILRLYTANRAVFLAHTPFAAPALVDSLSASWHADDVD